MLVFPFAKIVHVNIANFYAVVPNKKVIKGARWKNLILIKWKIYIVQNVTEILWERKGEYRKRRLFKNYIYIIFW